MVIYCILNKISLKRYIGSTSNFTKRKNTHLRELRDNTHHSTILQSSWNKYGEENFEFLILEKIDQKEDLILREQWWIDNTPSQYNICKKAGSCLGRKHSEESKKKIAFYNSNLRQFSEETRKKISESKKGKRRDSSTWKKRELKKIYEYDMEGVFIKEWESINEASYELNVSSSTILNALYNNFLLGKDKKRFSYNKVINLDYNVKTKNKKIYQYDINNNFITEWNSIKEATLFYQLKSFSSISNCLKGYSKTANGFIWKFFKD